MSLKFIDIKGTDSNFPDDIRASHFTDSDRTPGRLRVSGNLPHGYEFEPSSEADALKLISWLNRWLERNDSP